MNPLLKSVTHRPWPLPKRSWSFYQEWNDVVFLHWKVNHNTLRKLVPAELEIDLFQKQAWVSVVIFNMDKIRPKWLPSFSPISNFHEINIRTYVKSNGKSGVYFLSIEASKKLSCWLAESISKLPYRYAAINRTSNQVSANNSTSDSQLRLTFDTQNVIPEPKEIDLWLTERYALFQDAGNVTYYYDIHHKPWNISALNFNLDYNYPGFSNLFSGNPDLAHYSRGVNVLAWNKVIISDIGL